MPCPYSQILGIPKEGIHARRVFGLALFDTVATIIAAAITSYFMKVSFIYSLIVWFIGGEILHYIFGVQSEFLTQLGITVGC
jgi:hypothetical protein